MDQISLTDPEQSVAYDAMEKLQSGAYDDILETQMGLTGKIKETAKTFQTSGQESLRRMVSMSVNLNEAVTRSAQMIRDTREVDNRSQTIAAAAEELVASVAEIARNTEDAAADAQCARDTADHLE